MKSAGNEPAAAGSHALPAATAAPGAHAAGGPIPSLDGIRALSVGLVFFSHQGLGNIVPGGLGVTIFFVLSGYLITTLMREEFAARADVSFRAFYLRRLLRLIPPLLIVTALAVLLSLLTQLGDPFSLQGLLSVIFYYSNYFQIAHGLHLQPPGMGVTWSLAVEEHYYLLYPPLALVLLRSGRRPRAALTLAALCAAILAWRCWLALHGAGEDHLNMSTDTRVDAILVGCLLAFLRNPWLDPVPPASRGRDLALAAAWLALLVATLLWRNEFFRVTLRYTAQSVAIAGLLYLAVARARQAPYRWLNTRPMVYLGALSYTIYLAHFLMLLWADAHVAAFGRVAVTALTLALTLAVAALTHRYVEVPCARLRRRLHRAFIRERPPLRAPVGEQP